jgi:hypothetical protein
VVAGADRDVVDGLFNVGPQLPDEAELARQFALILTAQVAADDAMPLSRLVLVGEVTGLLPPRVLRLDLRSLFLPLSAPRTVTFFVA